MSAGRDWIARLQLEPHPEGGWFRRLYTGPTLHETAHGPRPLATSIWYLLADDQRLGRLHRNRSDILHFLIDGGPVDYVLVEDGALRRLRLSADGERQFTARGGVWKGSQLAPEASHVLIAEVVTPGFDYADHRFAGAEDLAGELQPHAKALAALIRS